MATSLSFWWGQCSGMAEMYGNMEFLGWWNEVASDKPLIGNGVTMEGLKWTTWRALSDVCIEDCTVFLTAAVFTVLSMPLVSTIGRIVLSLRRLKTSTYLQCWSPLVKCCFVSIISCPFSPGSWNFSGIFVWWFCNYIISTIPICFKDHWSFLQVGQRRKLPRWAWLCWWWLKVEGVLAAASIFFYMQYSWSPKQNIQDIVWNYRRGHLIFHVFLFLICLQDLFYFVIILFCTNFRADSPSLRSICFHAAKRRSLWATVEAIILIRCVYIHRLCI